MRKTVAFFVIAAQFAALGADEAAAKLEKIPGSGIPEGIVVRTTENVTKGGWVWLLNQCVENKIQRIDLLVKQDEDNFHSVRTGETLQSGDLLVPLPGEKAARGWEDATWLREMLAKAKEKKIEVWAWWPCFHDSTAAELFPAAAYSNKRDEHFVDPAFNEVRERQSVLLSKLLAEFPFDGVSLDWVRYDNWNAGIKGPLGAQFERQHNLTWSPETLENGYTKARWYEARARLLAGWVHDISEQMRTKHPRTRWGAFLLPWQFTETSQNYAMLGRSGLDFLQPMGYWHDWKLAPEWAGDRLLSQHRELANGCAQRLTLGIDDPADEISRALETVPTGVCAGVSWFTFGTWEQKTFDKLRALHQHDTAARRLFGYEAMPKLDHFSSVEIPPQPSKPSASSRPLRARDFPEDSSMWSVVCLAELYKRGALSAQGDDPAVPVLAFHTFGEGAARSQTYLYKCSSEYLDASLRFIKDAGFTVCPLSRLQNYLIMRDPSCLPPRPLVITIDDGSLSVKKIFYPRAAKYNFPFTLALVTDWLSDSESGRHSTDERGAPDPNLLWSEAKELYASDLVEIAAHSDAMHYQAAENPASQDEKPALVTRQFLREFNRTETNDEYQRRVRLDMITCRAKLVEHGFRAPTVFCWPYGEWNQQAKGIAEQAGFTHFLLFDTPPIFATAQSSRESIPRIPVLHPDEEVPLVFPQDRAEAQSYWLSFLKVARDSANIPLIRATLAQLTWESQRTAEAEISRAVIDFVRGANASGMTRLIELRQANAFDPAVTEAVDRVLKQFQPRPPIDTSPH